MRSKLFLMTSFLFLLTRISFSLYGQEYVEPEAVQETVSAEAVNYDNGNFYYDDFDYCYYCLGRPNDCHPCSQKAFDCGIRGMWMPPDPPLFRHFIADPRQLTYSVAWRFNDNALTKNSIPISFWDTFPIYRWLNIWLCGGMLQVELEGGLWAVFDPDTYSMPLINADYYVGIPLTYAFREWSFRLRYYHISSHIGDEYLLNHPDFDRKNPSAETLDFFVSNQLTPEIRLYGGLGWIVNMDKSFHTNRFLAACGLELRLYCLGFWSYRRDIFGHPFYGMHFRYSPEFRKHIDATYVLGYEFGKCCGDQKRLRAFIEYHDGYSVEGQFSKEANTYFSVRLSYGY